MWCWFHGIWWIYVGWGWLEQLEPEYREMESFNICYLQWKPLVNKIHHRTIWRKPIKNAQNPWNFQILRGQPSLSIHHSSAQQQHGNVQVLLDKTFFCLRHRGDIHELIQTSRQERIVRTNKLLPGLQSNKDTFPFTELLL